MKVRSMIEAWNAAQQIFPTDYEYDGDSSERAGYKIYRSTVEGNNEYICDLGNRLELNLNGNKTINIFVEDEPKVQMSKELYRDLYLMITAEIKSAEDMLEDQLQRLDQTAPNEDCTFTVMKIKKFRALIKEKKALLDKFESEVNEPQ